MLRSRPVYAYRFEGTRYDAGDKLGFLKATVELAKMAVQLDPVDSRAHLCCGWSYAMALREAEAAPHMELACELNDNDPWTLLSSAHYSAFCGSIEQAQQRAGIAHIDRSRRALGRPQPHPPDDDPVRARLDDRGATARASPSDLGSRVARRN